eukprot:SAG31_NODE_4036_length_3644_cov_6.694499_1_plen_1108_part_00
MAFRSLAGKGPVHEVWLFLLIAMAGAAVGGGDVEVRGALDELLQRMQALGMAAGNVSPDAAEAATAIPLSEDLPDTSRRGSFFEPERPKKVPNVETRSELLKAKRQLELDRKAQREALDLQFQEREAALDVRARDLGFVGFVDGSTSPGLSDTQGADRSPTCTSNTNATSSVAAGVGSRNGACQQFCGDTMDSNDYPIQDLYRCVEACPQVVDLDAMALAAIRYDCLGPNATREPSSPECQNLIDPGNFGNPNFPSLSRRRIEGTTVLDLVHSILKHASQATWLRILEPGQWSPTVAAAWLRTSAEMLQMTLHLLEGFPAEEQCRRCFGDPIEVKVEDMQTNKNFFRKISEIEMVAIDVERITHKVFYAMLNWIDYKIQFNASMLADEIRDHFQPNITTRAFGRPVVVKPTYARIHRVGKHLHEILVDVTAWPQKGQDSKKLTVPLMDLTDRIPVVEVFASEPMYSRRLNYGSDVTRPCPPVPLKAFVFRAENATSHLMLYRQISMSISVLRAQLREVRYAMRTRSEDPEGQPLVESPEVRTAAIADRLNHKDMNVRRAAAEALGKLGNYSLPYKPDIVHLLADDDDNVRAVAAEALSKLGVRDTEFGCDKDAFVRALEADGPTDRSILSWFKVSCSKSHAQCRLRCKTGYRIQGGLGDKNITYNCSKFGATWSPVAGATRFDPFKGMIPCGEETKVEGCDVPLMDFGMGRLYSCLDIKKNPWTIFGKQIATDCGARCSGSMDDSDACIEDGIVSYNRATVTNHNLLLSNKPTKLDEGDDQSNNPEKYKNGGKLAKVSCRAANPWGAISLKIPPNGVEMCIRTCTWPYSNNSESGDTGKREDLYSGFYPPDYIYSDRDYMITLIDLQSKALGIPPDYAMQENISIFVKGKAYALAAAKNNSIGQRLAQTLQELHRNTSYGNNKRADSANTSQKDAVEAKVTEADFHSRIERREMTAEHIQTPGVADDGTMTQTEPTRMSKASVESRPGEYEHFASMKTKELRKLLETFKINTAGAVEKRDLVQLAVERGIRAHSSESLDANSDVHAQETPHKSTSTEAVDHGFKATHNEGAHVKNEADDEDDDDSEEDSSTSTVRTKKKKKKKKKQK